MVPALAVLGAALGSWVLQGVAGEGQTEWRDAESIQPCGFEDAEALLPETSRAFSGHRLVQVPVSLQAHPQK